MSDVTIYYNDSCSKCRETLKLLEEIQPPPAVVEYLKTPPDLETLRILVKKLGMRPHELLRKKEEIFQSLQLDLDDDEAVLAAMVQHPILIERPIVVKGDRAAIGRPPEKAIKFLGL